MKPDPTNTSFNIIAGYQTSAMLYATTSPAMDISLSLNKTIFIGQFPRNGFRVRVGYVTIEVEVCISLLGG